jgi:protein farnesyltransferase subunit beta
MMTTQIDPPSIYDLPQTPLPSDNHPTSTLLEQIDTENVISELLSIVSPPTFSTKIQPVDGDVDSAAPSVLRRGEHNVFLGSNIAGLPAPYVALDASRPWLIYWIGHSLDIMGISLDETLRTR